jgi:hypothetical protein
LSLTLCSLAQTDVSFIEANARPPTSSPHISAGLSPITPFPVVAALPSYDHHTHSVVATILDFHYNQHNSQGNNVCSIDHPGVNNVAHEIWLGHFGPLNYRFTSAGPYMADVTFQLPSLSRLQTLHSEFHSKDDERIIRLPILFVRASQGTTFVSGHWLQAISYSQHQNSAQSSAYRPLESPTSWKITIV